MRHHIIKLTKEQLTAALHKNMRDCTENEIRFIFSIFDFNLKEFYQDGSLVDFEIHFKRNYLMRVVLQRNLLHFSNEYINFSSENDSTNGVSMPYPDTILDVVMLFINIFSPNVLKKAGYELSYNPETSIFDSIEEAQEYMELIQEEGREERKEADNE